MRHLWCSYGYRCLCERPFEVRNTFRSYPRFFVKVLYQPAPTKFFESKCSMELLISNFFKIYVSNRKKKKIMVLYETLFQAKKDVTWCQIVWTVLTNMTAFAKTTLKFLTLIEFVTAILIATISQTNLDAIGKMRKWLMTILTFFDFNNLFYFQMP